MKKTLYNESELKEKISEIYEEERIKIINEKWSRLSKEDQIFVLEVLKVLYPEKASLVTESKWYNTVGDIVGIFDPTGVVDLINGVSYWRQGDRLFAILSWVSVIPYLGDLIAKPVIGLMKIGGASAKAFKAATLTGNATKIGMAAKNSGGVIAKFVEKAPTWGTKLMNLLKKSVGKVPGLRGLLRVIEEYVNIFKGASKEMKTSSEIVGKLTKKSGQKALSQSEKDILAKELQKQSKFRGFRDYTGKGQSLTSKYLAGGMGRLWGNRATRSLMRRTKWYLGLLDFLGVANFVGPEEIELKYPDIENRINEYNQTPEAQQYAQEEFGDMSGGNMAAQTSSQIPQLSQSKSKEMDAISALASLF
jgi:hypothetical protein